MTTPSITPVAPRMMQACAKYEKEKCLFCQHSVEHHHRNKCDELANKGFCPACTPVAPQMMQACRWAQEADSDCWETSCDHAYSINDGTPAENEMRFCTFCGKPIEQVLCTDEEEDVDDAPPPAERIEVTPTPRKSLTCEDVGCDCVDPNGKFWRTRAEALERELADCRAENAKLQVLAHSHEQEEWGQRIRADDAEQQNAALRAVDAGHLSRIDGLKDRVKMLMSENAALKDGRWKAEGEAHETPCIYGSLCPWCEVIRLKEELGKFLGEYAPVPRHELSQCRLDGKLTCQYWQEKFEAAEQQNAALRGEVERLKTVSVANLSGAIETDKELEAAEARAAELERDCRAFSLTWQVAQRETVAGFPIIALDPPLVAELDALARKWAKP